MDKIKLSWSIISAWSSGRKDDAIKMIMGDTVAENIYMTEGKRIHKIISDKKLRLLPFIKDTAIFESDGDVIEGRINYFKVNVFDWLDMGMIIDVLDPVEKIIIDWKSGSRKSSEHNKMQLYVYAYLLSKLPEPIEIEKVIMAKVSESQQGVITCDDFCIYKINEEKLAVAENYIESNASEIYQFLMEAKNE